MISPFVEEGDRILTLAVHGRLTLPSAGPVDTSEYSVALNNGNARFPLDFVKIGTPGVC
jgi:hypothetical protein